MSNFPWKRWFTSWLYCSLAVGIIFHCLVEQRCCLYFLGLAIRPKLLISNSTNWLYCWDWSLNFLMHMTLKKWSSLCHRNANIFFLTMMQLPPHEPGVVHKAVNHFLQVWLFADQSLSPATSASPNFHCFDFMLRF